MRYNEMDGYRMPTQWEKEHICLYMVRDLRKTRGIMVIGSLLALIGSFSMFYALFKLNTMKTYVLYGILFLLFSAGFITLIKRLRWNKIYQNAIQSGAFEVMDCTVYDIDISPETGSEPAAKIKNKKGQKSERGYGIDYDSAMLVRENPSLPFVLMKTTIGVEKEELYELFSERKMANEKE